MTLEPKSVALRLAKLPSREMRSARLADDLESLSAEEAAWLLDALFGGGRAGGVPFELAQIAAADLVDNERLDYERRRAIFEAARAQGLEGCQALLWSAPEGGGSMEDEPRPLRPGDRPLTLGERKTLARSGARNVLERLLSDPNPDVVSLVLTNPRTTENDVVRIAGSRRSTPAILLTILRSSRFAPRRIVRWALVQNPHLPVGAALRLVNRLNRSELEQLRESPDLHAEVVAAVERLLRPPS